MRFLIAGALLLGASTVAAFPVDHNDTASKSYVATPIVRTENGPIVGYVDEGILAFKNIPYGNDTRYTRWKAPVPPPNWTQVRNCSAWGDIAPQPVTQTGIVGRQSEDCLNLNVWTPRLVGPQGGGSDGGSDSEDEEEVARGQRLRPVLVYFHGGGYESGTNNDPQYDGRRLAQRRNVVVVTVNSRINGFGYLYLGGASPDYTRGNAGQLDLILALQWIQKNIGRFGGDKSRVTIFGQSGGGAKCATLMAMPDAKGLFHRVWTMSGQQITGRTRAHVEADARNVLARTNATTVAAQISALNALSTEDLRQLLAPGSGQRWTPAVDGVTLPHDPFSPANEQSRDIPMVMGNTYDETRLLIGGSQPALFNLSWAGVAPALTANVAQFLGNLSADSVVAAYRAQYPAWTPTDVFFAAATAARSWKSMLVESDARAAQTDSPLWVYYFRWKSPLDGGKYGASHTYDIPFVFDNPDSVESSRGAAGAEALAEVMSKALVRFAETGEPEIEGREDLVWERYDLESRVAMIFDDKLEVHEDDRGWQRKFFENVPYIQPGT